MFFILSKVLSVFLSPLVWIFGLSIYALCLKKKIKRRNTLLAALLIFYIFSNNYLSEKVIKKWEIYNTTDTIANYHYDAGIVLGGGLVAFDEANQRNIYGQSSDRILQAIDLYNNNTIDKIIVSGGSGSLVNNDYSESIIIKQFLINIGVTATDILIDSVSRNTYENAIETKKLIDNNFPDGKFLLFTSGIHMRRASLCFHKQNIIFHTYSTNCIVRQKRYSFDYLFVPSTLAFYQWEAVIHEIAGLLTYKLIGYI